MLWWLSSFTTRADALGTRLLWHWGNDVLQVHLLQQSTSPAARIAAAAAALAAATTATAALALATASAFAVAAAPSRALRDCR